MSAAQSYPQLFTLAGHKNAKVVKCGILVWTSLEEDSVRWSEAMEFLGQGAYNI
ncbi:hypothetical protein CK203_011487 [Vitis vinifera]|uniref:Uncharacterized protein n=1 Tax=Vitis vinifera TaxID=29760 RepID=A0A438JUI9_VITVI|nr:hypothetical protein CK203_011487 [Vitis vinifera]